MDCGGTQKKNSEDSSTKISAPQITQKVKIGNYKKVGCEETYLGKQWKKGDQKGARSACLHESISLKLN